MTAGKPFVTAVSPILGDPYDNEAVSQLTRDSVMGGDQVVSEITRKHR
jgi:hypothetical protein